MQRFDNPCLGDSIILHGIKEVPVARAKAREKAGCGSWSKAFIPYQRL